MESVNIWSSQTAFRTLYAMCVEPVCHNYNITRAELDILMFLTNNPKYDTAAEISEIRHLAKSQVSISLKALEEEGYIDAVRENVDKRKVHLKVTKKAEPIIKEGLKEQNYFRSIVFEGFSEEEKKQLSNYLQRMEENMDNYLSEHE